MAWRYTKNGNVKTGYAQLSKIQHCKDCGVRLEPEFIDGDNADNWFWPECNGREVLGHVGCWEPVCSECSEEISEDGWRACNECLILTAQNQILRAKKFEKFKKWICF